MHAGRGDVGVSDERMDAIDRAMVQIKEAGRFAVTDHVAGLWIDRADFEVFGRRIVIVVWRQQLLAVRFAISGDCGIEFSQIVGGGLLNAMDLVMTLVGRGLQARTVGIKHPPADQDVLDRLDQDGIEDGLFDAGLAKAQVTVACEGRMIGHPVGQAQAEEPAISDVDGDLTHELAFRARAKQVTDEQNLEQNDGVKRGTTVYARNTGARTCLG